MEKKETINIESFKRKCKVTNFKRKVKEKVHNTVVWMEDNKEMLIIVVPAAASVVGGLFKLAKSVSHNVSVKQEQRYKDTHIYDRSLGRYVELKRPLSNKDMQVILDRKDNGEKLSSILMDLNLIK